MVNKKRHDTNGMHMLQTEARDQENQKMNRISSEKNNTKGSLQAQPST